MNGAYDWGFSIKQPFLFDKKVSLALKIRWKRDDR